MPDGPPVRPLVGRERERDRLDQALRGASAGTPRVVVIAGEAGIGKTTLVERFAADASNSDDLLVMSGACIAFGSEGLPLAPIIAALRQLVQKVGAEAVTSLLPAPSGLTHLLPEIGTAYGPGASQPPATREALLLPVVPALLERLSSERRVLLVIEDLQWADQSTVNLLDILARTVRNARLLTVVTYRSDGIPRGHRLRSFLPELERIRGVSRIELGPLSRAETAELVAVRTGGIPPSPATLNTIFDRSGGNPLFVEELLDAGEARLAATLRDLLITKLDALPRSTQALVRTASVAGCRVPHRLLAAAADLPDPVLLEQLETAVDGQILVPDGDGYAFQHTLLWEAVADSLLPGQRMRVHRAYATALETEPTLLTHEQVAAAVAHHWFAAQEPAKALPAMLHAASVAGALHAYAEQHQMLMHSLDLLSQVPNADVARPELVAQAARAAMRAGELETALELVDQALADRHPGADAAFRATLLEQRTRLLLHLGRDGALVAAEEAEQYAPEGSDIRISVLDALAAALLRDSTPADAQKMAAEAVELAEKLGDVGKEIAARTTLAQTLVQLAQHEGAVQELQRARPLAEQAGHQAGLAGSTSTSPRHSGPWAGSRRRPPAHSRVVRSPPTPASRTPSAVTSLRSARCLCWPKVAGVTRTRSSTRRCSWIRRAGSPPSRCWSAATSPPAAGIW